MTLRDLAKAKWLSSALTNQQAKALKLKPIPDPSRLSLNFKPAGALQIPYFDLNGKTTKFYRLRYLEDLPGFAGKTAKPQRYDQPVGTLNEAYFPPLLNGLGTWAKVSQDPDIPVCITEGELKAACGTAHEIPTIGLGGVHVFKSAKNGVQFFKALADFNWKAREVRVVFDNDISHKVEVMQAQRMLAQELLSRGAKVSIVEIPPGPDKGLDDYIKAHGVDSFQKLVDEAPPFEESRALWDLNEELVYIREIDGIIERKTVMLMKPLAFVKSIYANRYYIKREEKTFGKGDKRVTVPTLVKTPLAPHWLAWEHRAELKRLAYEPGKPKVFDDQWNAWNGWGCDPKAGDVQPWHDLLRLLFGDDLKAKEWFERWCAYPLQHPGTKMYSAVLLWSRVKRVGKNLIAHLLREIYGENAAVIGARDLKATFNWWAVNRQLVIGDEITAGEARLESDHLKGLITQSHITIRAKYKPEYTLRDCIQHLYLSNHPDALFLEIGDGRFFVHEIRVTEAQRDLPDTQALYQRVDAFLHGDGPSRLFHYLLNLDLGDFNPLGHAPEGPSKAAMVRAGMSDLGLWIQTLKEDPRQALMALGEKRATECDLYTPGQLFRAFDPDRSKRASEAGMGRSLSAAGFRQLNSGQPMSIHPMGVYRLYAVRNQIFWEQSTDAEIKEHFTKYWGPETLGVLK
jgi:hypothetical protein